MFCGAALRGWSWCFFTGRVLPKTGSRGTVARSAELQGRFHEPSQEFHAYRDRLRFALRFGTAAGPVHATWPWHVVEPNNSPDFHSLRPVDKLRCSGCACLGRRGPQARRASCSMHAEVRSAQLACSCATLCNCAAVPEDVRWSPRPHPYAALARRPGGPGAPARLCPVWQDVRRGSQPDVEGWPWQRQKACAEQDRVRETPGTQ